MKRKILVVYGVFIVFGLTCCGSVLKKENFKIRDAEILSLLTMIMDLLNLKYLKGGRLMY